MPRRHRSPASQAVELFLPFTGPWKVQNSPANRVPSHGTDLFGTRYAIDFTAVDDRGRTAGSRSWRSAVATEPAELFFGYGQEVLAPCPGTVQVTHGGEADHAARRSQPALLGYLLGQPARIRQGPEAVAGNHVILEEPQSGRPIALVHLLKGSIRVRPGQQVAAGQVLARCGNSGNSTQPHLHLQAMDALDLRRARGVPIVFRDFHEQIRSGETAVIRRGVPANASLVQSAQSARR